jgi:virginiamycin A acetyltransferase
LSLRCTEGFASLCYDLGITFHLREPRVPADGHIIHTTKRTEIEEFAGLFAGATFLPRRMGAFSYSHSPLFEISVGRYCAISWGVRTITANHPLTWVSTSPAFYQVAEHSNLAAAFRGTDLPRPHPHGYAPAQIEIGHDVWIGEHVTLGRRLKVGTGAILAANAVVTKDVPPYAIVGGNPAKIIRYRFPEDEIDLLLKSRWWEYHARDIAPLDPTDVRGFVAALEDKIAAGRMHRHRFRCLRVSDGVASSAMVDDAA